MSSEFLRAVEKLHLDADDQAVEQDECIDGILSQQRPRKRIKSDPKLLKRKLEDNFLSPPYVLFHADPPL
jgi:antiviral helicase SKI2